MSEENLTEDLVQQPATSEAPLLPNMYQNWFLDYASYVILERAVPHLGDGLKPVQRRILHTMKRMDDGRYNKVANIVGEAMKFHPHGDASIKDALVQLGQKDLLIDCQGNWGNILTGDDAAAGRYIEARLTKLALDIVFNPKTTEWKLSYDGRNKEPVSLPVKFPLLLAQGAEGIAVGLSAKILPHNFGELCQAAISYLKGEEFHLFPDFPTGGSIDVSKYNDGMRGGVVKVRAKIEKRDPKTLAITEVPFSKTTGTLIESILKANEKGKIKILKVDDNTAAQAEILVHLRPGTSSDKTIDALYAFTDCEVSISPNCCVIDDKTPRFVTVSDVLRHSADNTKALLRQELIIRRDELLEQLHFCSLERIFIEERIYKDKEFEQAPDMDAAVKHIDKRLQPWYPQMVREVTRDDILRLMEIKMARILKFNKDKADELIAKLKADIAAIERDLKRMTEVTIKWFKGIYDKYAAQYPRHTEIRSFETIEATKVVEANEKLYINREEGFIGTALKKDEFVENCSSIDAAIIFYNDGTYKVTRIQDKTFIGETEKSKTEKRKAQVVHIAVFKKNDTRTIYNVVYRDGRHGNYYIKRFNVTGITLDREYDLTLGTPGSRVCYFSPNPNGEAEVIKVYFKPNPSRRKMKLSMDKDFSEIGVKGRGTKGYLLCKEDVLRILLKSHGGSTLGGRKVWFDWDVQRLNYDEHGEYLGEFHADDLVLVILRNGRYYTTSFDPNNHFEAAQDLLRVEKYRPRKVWTAVLKDAHYDMNLYCKRFTLEVAAATRGKHFMGADLEHSELLLLTDTVYPLLQVTFPGGDRAPITFDAEAETAVKPYDSLRGTRITTLKIDKVTELEPVRMPEEPEEDENDNINENDNDNENGKPTEQPAEDKGDDKPDDKPTDKASDKKGDEPDDEPTPAASAPKPRAKRKPAPEPPAPKPYADETPVIIDFDDDDDTPTKDGPAADGQLSLF